MNLKKLLRFHLIVFLLLLFPGTLIFAQDVTSFAKKKPFQVHGNANVNPIGYGISGLEGRHQPFSWVLSANITASFYSLELPFSFIISDLQRGYAQPFNQFGMSPRWKKLTVHFGYRNVTFSNYTLAGRTFVGAGAEVSLGLLRLGAVYGRFDRQTNESPSVMSDTLPQFKSLGYAVRFGIGSERKFLDLILLRIQDDSNSIKQQDTNTIRTPEQNVVAGFNSRYTFSKTLSFEAEGAFSFFTTNIGAKPILDNKNSLFYSTINEFVSINQSSEYYYALKSNLQYQGKKVKLKLEYKRIDPKFRSMGAYFFNSDLENITLSPTFKMWKRKIVLGGSVGLQRDNLRGNKKTTSVRTIGSTVLSFNPAPVFGIDINYSNYSMNQRSGRIPLIDSVRIHQVTRNLSLIPRLLFVTPTKTQSIIFTYVWMGLDDLNDNTNQFSAMTTQTLQALYSLGLIETQWTFNGGPNYLSMENFSGTSIGYGLTAGLSKILFNNALTLGFNNAVMRTEYVDSKGWIHNINMSVSYLFKSHHNFRFSLYYTGNYFPEGSINPSYKEWKGDLMYVYTF